MNTFIDIVQCFQEISVIDHDHKKMTTKEMVIIKHTDRHMFAF